VFRPNWSGIDRYSPLGRALRAPLRLIPPSITIKIRRGPAEGLRWIVGSADHGCWLGTYELAKQNVLLRFAAAGMTVFDLGAQAGFYTLLFSSVVGPQGKVFAFEPCPLESQNLLRHIQLNRLSNVTVLTVALAAQNGFGRFSIDTGQTQNSLCAEAKSPLLVPTISLDQLDLPPPDLIKLDIEGGESDALLGAQRILAENRPVIFLALHGAEHRSRCFTLLRKYDYSLFDLAGHSLDQKIDTDEIYALPDRSKSRTNKTQNPFLSVE
jgi:FkbM family methyltransferase